MNRKQRIVLFLGFVLMVINLLYPPYCCKQTQYIGWDTQKKTTKFLGYRLIFIGPPESVSHRNSVYLKDGIIIDMRDGKILIPLWIGQLIVIVILTVVLVKVFKSKPQMLS
jgi:hypothetical protein